MTTPFDSGQGSLELLELDRFDTAFTVGPDRSAETRRRLMTLFLDADHARSYGSSGYVCKAYNSTGEVFAVKRLRSNQMLTPLPGEDKARFTSGQIAAFEEEYRSQEQLSHMKGFPKLYGLGYAGDEPVIVMEWVEGLTLYQARGRLPQSDEGVSPVVVAHIGRALFSILEGLDRLSERPVHRDISPSNIMVRTDRHSLDEQLQTLEFDLCLIDFGSATVIDEGSARFTMLTDVWRNGTPEYAPPEMLTHDVADIEHLRQSPSIDVYASCSVLYELLVARTPFSIANQRTRSPYRVKTESDPVPLPERFGLLGQAIMGGLQREQSARCSASQMLALCNRFVGIEQAASLAVPTDVQGGIPPMADFETTRLSMPSTGPSAVPSAASAAGFPASQGYLASGAGAGIVQQRAAEAGAFSADAASPVAPRSPGMSRRTFVVAAACVAGAAAVGGLVVARPWNTGASSQASSAEGAASSAVHEQQGLQTGEYQGGTLLLAQDGNTGMWGYLDSQRQWVIEPRFPETPGFFSEGLAFAKDPETGLFGYIDYYGEWAIEPKYVSAGTFYEDGLSPVQATPSGSGLLGWIDRSGQWVIDPIYQAGGAFRQGLATFSLDAATSDSPTYGYLDTSGNEAIAPSFHSASSFGSEGLAPAARDMASWGWINKQGEWAIQPDYAQARIFSEGLAGAMDVWSERWGLVDAQGSLVVDFLFGAVRKFSQGALAAKDAESSLWGFVDAQGSWTVDPAFSDLGDISHGLAPARDLETQLYGYIDDQGQWVIPPSFMAVGLAAVE